jgi:hypothetical protein
MAAVRGLFGALTTAAGVGTALDSGGDRVVVRTRSRDRELKFLRTICGLTPNGRRTRRCRQACDLRFCSAPGRIRTCATASGARKPLSGGFGEVRSSGEKTLVLLKNLHSDHRVLSLAVHDGIRTSCGPSAD